MKTASLILLGIAVATVGPLPGADPARAADPDETSKNVIAVQLRKQGFECSNPASAERDPAAAKPDEAAWILRCEGVTYKVQLIPNQAAKVERVANGSPAAGRSDAPEQP